MADEPSDFLARERALLGDDADQFATPADNAATAGDDDLLGGGESHQAPADHEMGGFESSFPAIDTSNEVGLLLLFLSTIKQTAFIDAHIHYRV